MKHTNEFRIEEACRVFVQSKLKDHEGGHDYWHCIRVAKMAEKIAIAEGGERHLCVISALLHDISDPKFNGGDEKMGASIAFDFLLRVGEKAELTERVASIINNISFAGGKKKGNDLSLECNIVQDADRLDALGAIGIARTFNYGGFKNRPLYDPDIKPVVYQSTEAYRKSIAPTLNHFYEKLLLLKDLMNTNTARVLAEERHKYLVLYLKTFLAEWDGNL